MDFAYKLVIKIKNPVLKRITYHLVQMIIGLILGLLCGVLTQSILNMGAPLDTKQLLILSVSMSIGWLVLSLGWYSRTKDFYDNQK